METSNAQLVIDGGKPVVTEPLPGGLQGVLDIGQPEMDAVMAVLKRKTMWRFLNAPEISESTQLEAKYRKFIGVDHALALGGGGTCALIAALVGLDIASGDEVIIPGYTYIATAAACLSVGAIPVLAEVDESLTINVDDLERRLTPYTKAIIPVHMRGAICNMDAILAFARKHNLKVLEDCAQANGGRYKGNPVGGIGDAGAFSLQHFKVITAAEGGIVTTRDERVWRRAAMKHDSAMCFWKPDAKWESFAGENYRMCELRAAVGLAQFDRLEGILARTRQTKKGILAHLAGLKGVRPQKFHDADGDTGVTLNLFLDSPAKAKRFSEVLAAEGVRNGTIYNKEIPDRHIYTAWDYVLEKKTSDHTGWPWNQAHRPISYSKDMLPATLDVLSRCVTLGLNQHWTQNHVQLVGTALRKVALALAAKGEI